MNPYVGDAAGKEVPEMRPAGIIHDGDVQYRRQTVTQNLQDGGQAAGPRFQEMPIGGSLFLSPAIPGRTDLS